MTYPISLDLKSWADEIEKQGINQSCVGQAGTSALELMSKKIGVEVNYSADYLWWALKKVASKTGNVSTNPKHLDIALKKYGVVLSDQFKGQGEPSPDVISTANLSFYSKEIYKEDIKRYLNNGVPVLCGMYVTETWEKLTGDWKTHTWKTFPEAYGHEVLIIGYDDSVNRYLCENSMGVDFGDHGFFGLPYNFISSKTVFHVIEGVYPCSVEMAESIKNYISPILYKLKQDALKYNITDSMIDYSMDWPKDTWSTIKE